MHLWKNYWDKYKKYDIISVKRMKKLLTCFFAIMVVAPAAIAAGGGISRVIPTGTETENTSLRGSNETESTSRVASRAPVERAEKKAADAEQTVRTAVSRVFSGAPETSVGARSTTAARSNVISRSVAASPSGGETSRDKLKSAVNTVGRNERVSAAGINSDPSVRRAGLVLRPSTAEVGGRAIIGDTGLQTGSNIDEQVRGVKSRAAATVTAESIAEATQRLEQTATLNKSCQEQYNDCMDQFCAVIDANQKRCSCSANLNRYTKVEKAVKDANSQLNEVAQRIRYVGLSADEIRAILSETEAEEALSGQKDTSETRDMLEEIEALIKDPVSNTSYVDTSGSVGLDMDLDFSSESSDIFSLDFLGSNTESFSNLRGTSLYNAAKKRCNSVLTQCKGAGATVKQITGNYDLAIDKDCIAYEQGLTKMNETLVSNVRSAERMLQKARLAVLQNKNQYDARGCIAALNTCMTDDMVCGDNYFKCVDPTKRYIDENGQVVLGQKISNITEFMENYNNASITTEFLSNAYTNQQINETECNKDAQSGNMGGNDGSCVVKYLLTKVGTKQRVTDEGLCRAVLDKCQNYTYDGDKYKSFNDIVVNYIQRAMVNIRAAQQNIISEYASTCMVDVADCYNQQVTQVNSWTTTANEANVYNVMRGACRNVALTCAYAVFSKDEDSCPSDNDNKCINNISEMFYQSLLCPENSVYDSDGADEDDIGNNKTYVSKHCECKNGYVAWGNLCVVECATGETRNSAGVCEKTSS